MTDGNLSSDAAHGRRELEMWMGPVTELVSTFGMVCALDFKVQPPFFCSPFYLFSLFIFIFYLTLVLWLFSLEPFRFRPSVSERGSGLGVQSEPHSMLGYTQTARVLSPFPCL